MTESKKTFSGKRSRYWASHEMPKQKKSCLPGMQQRLMRQDILDTVALMGAASDVAVVRQAKATDRVSLMALRIHQDRMRGALIRLKRMNPWQVRIPPKLQNEHFKSAERAIQEAA